MTDELPGPERRGKDYCRSHLIATRQALISSNATANVCREFRAERARQDQRWGRQNHPSFAPGRSMAFLQGQMDSARRLAEHHAANGTLTWDDILMEEVHEVRATDNPQDLRAELVQVMAVAGAWIESLDRHESGVSLRGPQGMSDELAAAAEEQRWEDTVRRQERETIDVTTFAGAPDMPMVAPGLLDIEAEAPRRTIQGMGMTYATRKALDEMGYEVEEFPQGSALFDCIAIKPKAPKPDGPRSPWVTPRNDGQPHDPGCRWTFSAHPAGCLDDPNGRWVTHNVGDECTQGSEHRAPCVDDERTSLRTGRTMNAVGAAGQPVSSYSGGGVRDVTEGKPRIDLMWPLGVPFEAQMLTRVGMWLERGMRKYAERNWERFHTPDALVHALASMSRHYAEYMTNEATRENCATCNHVGGLTAEEQEPVYDPDPGCTCHEDHAAAIITNVIFAETIRWKIANGWTPEGTFGS